MMEAAQLDNIDLHGFLGLDRPAPMPHQSLLPNEHGLLGDYCGPDFLDGSPNTSVDSLCGSGSSAFPFEGELGEILLLPYDKRSTPSMAYMEHSQDTKQRGRSAVPAGAHFRASPESPAARSTGGKSAKARTAAAMERNRRGARKFRERQKQKFSDLTNRVEMLETELIAMKLCKLKMEADKTEAELQVKQMEKTLHAIQNGHSSQDEASELDSASVSGGGIEGSIISVPDGPTMTAREISTLSFTQAFAIHKNYVFTLRECLKEMESDELDQYFIAEKLDCLTRDLGILARCMQRSSNVPLWRLYAKQEWCEGPSSDLGYEREMLGKLDVSNEQKGALQQAVCKYRGELHALASERKQLNAVLAQAAAPGKSDGIKKAQSVMWALKSSLAKEPVMTEELLGSSMAALRPVQIAQLIVAAFPRTVWPDLYAFCSAALPRNGSTHRGHA